MSAHTVPTSGEACRRQIRLNPEVVGHLNSLLFVAVQQYFKGNGKYQYITVATFADNFQKTYIAKQQMQYLEEPYKAPNKKCEEALITHHYALNCMSSSLCLVARQVAKLRESIPIDC